MKSAVVTGVSTGIGRATLGVLCCNGWTVFGSVRHEADAAKLQEEFGEAFVPLVFDVENEDAIARAAATVAQHLQGRTLTGLVNNAGISFKDPLLVQSVADFRKQVEINLVGVFAVTRTFAPLLGADPARTGAKGRIVNISSIGGRLAPPFLGAYAATKHGVEGLSESLRRELLLLGIDVIIVAPGAVKTAIWDKAEAAPVDHLRGTIWEKPVKAFQDYMLKNGRAGLEPEQVGQVILTALTATKPRTRYSIMRGRFINETLPLMLPSRMVDRLLGRQLGLLPSGGSS